MSTIRSSAVLAQISNQQSTEKIIAERKDAYIAFQILDEYFALPIQNVRYSMSVGKITPVPDVPGFVLGITNVLGEIISIVDISDFIFQKPVLINQKKCFLLLIEWNGIDTSFVVTDLIDMVLLGKSEIRKDLLPVSKEKKAYFEGGAFWNERIIGVLSLDKIFSSERMHFDED